MKEAHIILRDTTPSTRDVFLGTLSEAPAPAPAGGVNFAIEVENIEASQIPAVAANRDVRAVAPSMPIKLIAPLEADTGAGAQPVAASVAWGVKAVGADTSPFNGDGAIVAVLDTGIDRAHAAFAAMGQGAIVEQDFTGEGNGDVHGHGTHCAGTIFGRNVDGTRIGVAPGVKKVLIGKVIGRQGGASLGIVNAIQWAQDHGAHVVSMSLGIDFPGYVERLRQQGLAPEAAVSRGLEGYRANVMLFERLATFIRAKSMMTQPMIIVAAAGNESHKPSYDIAVSPPAVAEGIVSVAALAQDSAGLKIANFSNVGANVAAPGVNITSAKLGGGLTAMSGTSMATPHVAGLVALWLHKIMSGPAVGNALQLLAILLGSASTQPLAPGFSPVDVGLGLVRAPQN